MANQGRGFASMDQEKQRKIASKGGKASHKNGSNKTSQSNKSGQGRKGTNQQA